LMCLKLDRPVPVSCLLAPRYNGLRRPIMFVSGMIKKSLKVTIHDYNNSW